MGDSVKKYHEILEEENPLNKLPGFMGTEKGYSNAKYVFILDFTDSKAYRYDISSLCNKENNWEPDVNAVEAFLFGAGHKMANCEWMVTENGGIEFAN